MTLADTCTQREGLFSSKKKTRCSVFLRLIVQEEGTGNSMSDFRLSSPVLVVFRDLFILLNPHLFPRLLFKSDIFPLSQNANMVLAPRAPFLSIFFYPLACIVPFLLPFSLYFFSLSFFFRIFLLFLVPFLTIPLEGEGRVVFSST